ncbi:MAG TPA: DUF4199 domain-containing protein [Opitutaceae bacterium]
MKTCSLYGLILAITGAIVTLVLFFLGFHSDPAKVGTGQMIGGLTILAASIVITSLGIKARRAEVPGSEPFGYGRALGAGVLISLVAVVLSTVFNIIYTVFINTGFTEVMVQAQMDKLQAKGLSGAQLDQAEKMTRMMMGPVPAAIVGILFGMIIGTIISLILAAFLKRPAPPAGIRQV